MKKIKFALIAIALISVICSSNVIFADDSGKDYLNSIGGEFDSTLVNKVDITGNTQYNEINSFVSNVVGIVVLLVQVISVGGIIACGVIYMFAGASKKAQLKKSLIGISVGCIILFGGSTLVTLITNVFGELK